MKNKVVTKLGGASRKPGLSLQIKTLQCLAALFLIVEILAYVLRPPAAIASMIEIPTRMEPITPIPQPPAADLRKLVLGARLFDDPRLSGDGTRACSSCHDLQTNGSDNRRLDVAPDGSRLAFNTPTVFNVSLNFRVNWEGNYRTLEEGTDASLEAPEMMGANLPNLLKVLTADPSLRRQFAAIYGHAPDRDSLIDAISTFESSLLTPDSRFDHWLEGDTAALSEQEKQGYQLFKAVGCASCHQGENVGGNLFERSGIYHPLTSADSPLLRVPSLRNVAVTAPYFHDGSAATLDDAVRKMARAQLGEEMSHTQTEAIVAFLGTLTGEYQGKPVTAPAP